MTTEAIQITISGNIKGDVATRIREIGAAARSSHTDVDLLKQALQGFSALTELKQAANNTKALTNEIKRATAAQNTFAAENQQAAASLNSAALAATRYGATLKQIDGASVRFTQTTRTLQASLSSLVGLFGGIFAITQYAQAQDALTSMQNKIRSVTTSLQQQAAVQDELFNIANRTRSGVVATTDGFVRFAKALRGTPNTEVLRFVETLNKSLITAGRSTSEVNSIVIQLGQALTSGRLMGDEFRSLSENLPYDALQAIADVLGVNVSELKALSSEGAITAQVLREAFANMAAGVDEAFAKTLPTIGQAFTVLNNQFIAFTENSSSGAQLVSGAILLIAQNLNTLIPVVLGFAAAWLTVKAGTILFEIATVITTVLVPAMASGALATFAFLGPWGLLVTAVLLAAAALAYFTGGLDPFIAKISDFLGGVGKAATELLGMDTASLKASLGLTKAQEAAINGTDGMKGLSASTGSASDAMEELGLKSTSAAAQTVRATNNITAGFARMTAAAEKAAKAAYSALQAQGGSSRSFTALPERINNTTNGPTITDVPRPNQFARGGSAIVTGRAGVDRNLVRIAASKGERINVETKKQQRQNDNRTRSQTGGDKHFTFIVNTPDADSFRRSRQQIASEMQSVIGL